MQNIINLEDSNEPPSSKTLEGQDIKGDCSIRPINSSNGDSIDFWRSFFIYHAIYSRGVTHNLLPLSKSL